MASTTETAGLALSPRAAVEVLVSATGVTILVAEGDDRAVHVVAAMRACLGARPSADEQWTAWQAGETSAGGARLSALIACVRDGRATIRHAGDLAVHVIDRRGSRRIVAPHTRLGEGDVVPLRIRSRGLGLPGAASQSELTQLDLGEARRLVVTTAGVWAALGDELPRLLDDHSPCSLLASSLVAAAASATSPMARAVAAVPRACAVVALPSRGSDDHVPALVPVAAQREARRAIRGILARSVGVRGVVLVGERGAGKTTVLEHLVRERGSDAALIAPSAARRTVKTGASLAAASGAVFIDRIFDVVGSDLAIGSALAEAIADARLGLVTTATPDELARLRAAHHGLCTRLAVVELTAPTAAELVAIAAAWAPRLARRYAVRIEPSAIAAAVELSLRFVGERAEPEAALFALEQACLRAGNANIVSGTAAGRGGGVADRTAVAAAIADQRGIALALVDGDDAVRARELAPRLGGRLHGQVAATAQIGAAVVRGAAVRARDPRGTRPIASLLLLGRTGTGKSETARLLAEHWYLDRRALTTIDLSEYRDPASAARLTGAAAGYIGYDERPALARTLSARPQQVVLFDELEKACSEVQLLLLQILDEGRLTTGRGEHVSFADSLVVMTSNLDVGGAKSALGFREQVASPRDRDGSVRRELASHLRPELVARIDEIVVFEPLDRAASTAIAWGHFARCADALMSAGRLPAERLSAMRRDIAAELEAMRDFAGGARETLRLVDRVLASEPGRQTRPTQMIVVCPYHASGRDQLAAGVLVAFAPGTSAAAAVHTALVHPAHAPLLYLAHDDARALVLVGDLAIANELAEALRAFGEVRTSTGRIRVDLANRPVGELIDRLLSG